MYLPTFFDEKNRIVYVTGLRCGSSNLRRISDRLDYFSEQIESDSKISCNSISTELLSNPELHDIKVKFLYRDPIARYVSGLTIVTDNIFGNGFRPISKQYSLSSRKGKEILYDGISNILNNGWFFDYSITDGHLVPMNIMCACIASIIPQEIEFVHLDDLDALMRPLYGDVLDDWRVEKSADVQTPFGKKVFEEILCKFPQFIQHPEHRKYDFYKWIQPDIDIIHAMRTNDKDKLIEALIILMDDPFFLFRNKNIYTFLSPAWSNDCGFLTVEMFDHPLVTALRDKYHKRGEDFMHITETMELW